jgi:prepilin signal peptidase PulO-like enzyme (type II secretory pathway)
MAYRLPIDDIGMFIALSALAGAAVGLVLTRVVNALLVRLAQHYLDPAEASAADEQAPSESVAGISPLDAALLRSSAKEYGVLAVFGAAAFAGCAWRFGPVPLALCAMVLCAALIVLASIDLQVRLLPDAVTLPLAWLGLLVNLNGAFVPLPQAVLGAICGYVFPWLLFHIFRFFTGRDGMGYGDFKLLAALGAWLGVAALPALLLGASLAGVVAGLLLRVLGRVERGQALPFGPYLVAAGLITLYFPGVRLW